MLAGVASAAITNQHSVGSVVAVRSGDDADRINMDQRFDRVRAAAGRLHRATETATLAAEV